MTIAFLGGIAACLGQAALPPATEKPMQPHLDTDVRRVVIRQAPGGKYAMYGGLTRLPDGEIFCVFKTGSLDKKTGSPWTVRDETIVWSRSSGKGLTWPAEENVIYKDGATRQENCCGRGYLTKKGLLIHPFYVLNADYEEEAREDNWSKVRLALTQDMGKTWRFRELDLPLAIAASFGGIVRLRDGTLLLNVYGAAKRGSFRHEAALLRSTDDGETWSDYAIIGKDADPDHGPARLNETDVVEIPSGRWLSMSRTQYDQFPIYRGVSDDQGRSWKMEASGLTGLCPSLCFSASGPPEGTVVVAYHDRWGRHSAKGGVYLSFSQDGGASWGEPVWISSGAYPCMIEKEAGTIFCSCYESSALLRGSVFSVPFPSGLRAAANPAGVARGVRLEWDKYSGQKARDYCYRVYRSAGANVEDVPENLIGTLRDTNAYEDTRVQPGETWHYRVAAYEGESRVGHSWTAAARMDGG